MPNGLSRTVAQPSSGGHVGTPALEEIGALGRLAESFSRSQDGDGLVVPDFEHRLLGALSAPPPELCDLLDLGFRRQGVVVARSTDAIDRVGEFAPLRRHS